MSPPASPPLSRLCSLQVNPQVSRQTSPRASLLANRVASQLLAPHPPRRGNRRFSPPDGQAPNPLRGPLKGQPLNRVCSQRAVLLCSPAEARLLSPPHSRPATQVGNRRPSPPQTLPASRLGVPPLSPRCSLRAVLPVSPALVRPRSPATHRLFSLPVSPLDSLRLNHRDNQRRVHPHNRQINPALSQVLSLVCVRPFNPVRSLLVCPRCNPATYRRLNQPTALHACQPECPPHSPRGRLLFSQPVCPLCSLRLSLRRSRLQIHQISRPSNRQLSHPPGLLLSLRRCPHTSQRANPQDPRQDSRPDNRPGSPQVSLAGSLQANPLPSRRASPAPCQLNPLPNQAHNRRRAHRASPPDNLLASQQVSRVVHRLDSRPGSPLCSLRADPVPCPPPPPPPPRRL